MSTQTHVPAPVPSPGGGAAAESESNRHVIPALRRRRTPGMYNTSTLREQFEGVVRFTNDVLVSAADTDDLRAAILRLGQNNGATKCWFIASTTMTARDGEDAMEWLKRYIERNHIVKGVTYTHALRVGTVGWIVYIECTRRATSREHFLDEIVPVSVFGVYVRECMCALRGYVRACPQYHCIMDNAAARAGEHACTWTFGTRGRGIGSTNRVTNVGAATVHTDTGQASAVVSTPAVPVLDTQFVWIETALTRLLGRSASLWFSGLPDSRNVGNLLRVKPEHVTSARRRLWVLVVQNYTSEHDETFRRRVLQGMQNENGDAHDQPPTIWPSYVAMVHNHVARQAVIYVELFQRPHMTWYDLATHLFRECVTPPRVTALGLPTRMAPYVCHDVTHASVDSGSSTCWKFGIPVFGLHLYLGRRDDGGETAATRVDEAVASTIDAESCIDTIRSAIVGQQMSMIGVLGGSEMYQSRVALFVVRGLVSNVVDRIVEMLCDAMTNMPTGRVRVPKPLQNMPQYAVIVHEHPDLCVYTEFPQNRPITRKGALRLISHVLYECDAAACEVDAILGMHAERQRYRSILEKFVVANSTIRFWFHGKPTKCRRAWPAVMGGSTDAPHAQFTQHNVVCVPVRTMTKSVLSSMRHHPIHADMYGRVSREDADQSRSLLFVLDLDWMPVVAHVTGTVPFAVMIKARIHTQVDAALHCAYRGARWDGDESTADLNGLRSNTRISSDLLRAETRLVERNVATVECIIVFRSTLYEARMRANSGSTTTTTAPDNSESRTSEPKRTHTDDDGVANGPRAADHDECEHVRGEDLLLVSGVSPTGGLFLALVPAWRNELVVRTQQLDDAQFWVFVGRALAHHMTITNTQFAAIYTACGVIAEHPRAAAAFVEDMDAEWARLNDPSTDHVADVCELHKSARLTPPLILLVVYISLRDNIMMLEGQYPATRARLETAQQHLLDAVCTQPRDPTRMLDAMIASCTEDCGVDVLRARRTAMDTADQHDM